MKGSWFIPSSSKDGLGLTYAFYRYNRLRVWLVRWVGRGMGAAALRRPQSSPILVEDTHAAVGVAEVPIIVRYQSDPIWVAINPRCDPGQAGSKTPVSLNLGIEIILSIMIHDSGKY